VPIAVKTGEGEILKNSLAAMLTCNDVIDVKGQRIEVSRKVTLLTSALGTLPDFRTTTRFTSDGDPAALS
jgi:hypothetical protein